MQTSVTLQVDGQLAVVTVSNPPVNALSSSVRRGLVDAVATTESDPRVHVVIMVCDGRTFIAGADIREFGQPAVEPLLPEVIRSMESATKPWVAAIHGTALGGGLEVALACHYRVAMSSAKLGLPEVTLGLIPGAGGTVRLPRLISSEAALDIIAHGKPVAADKACALGLIDKVISGDLLGEASAFARAVVDQPVPQPLIDRPVRHPVDAEQWAMQCASIKRKAAALLAPAAAVKALQNTVELPAHDALAAERELFIELRDGEQSSALQHVFLAERRAGKRPELKGVAPRGLSEIGIVGGGTMGAGIATACLLSGLRVILIERCDLALTEGRERVKTLLQGSLQRGLITTTQQLAMLDSFEGSTDYSRLNNSDLVIEAVFEDMGVKHVVFASLDKATRPDAILASNTSYLDINQIAQAVRDRSRVIGLHFFSPAHIMKLLELVIADESHPEAVATGLALGKRLGKISVAAGVCDGFIGNRIMSAYRRECDYLLEDGAFPEQIDSAMREFGFPMGIYEMQDMAGLDISWAMRKRQASTRDPAERYVSIADQLCELGRFGRKSGYGWYRYEGGKALVDPAVTALIKQASEAHGIRRQTTEAERIMQRILEVMHATGQAILEEGIARSAADIDVVMINGYGFPRFRGGPMYMKQR